MARGQKRQVKEVSEGWITTLYVLAFLRAAIAVATGLYAVLGGEVDIGAMRIGMWAFLDAGLLTTFGVGAFKRRLWAGYGLVVFAALDVAVKAASEAYAGALGGSLWVAVFATGTIHLFRAQRFHSAIRLDLPFIFRWAGVLLFIAFLVGFFQTFNPAFLAKMLGAPKSPGRVWTISIVGYVLMFASQTFAAGRKEDWSLEHVLCSAIVASLAGAVVDLAFGGSAIQALSGSVWLFILTFIAWGTAKRLKMQKPASSG